VTLGARLHTSTRLMVGLFCLSGLLHLLRPQAFERLVPTWLPARRAVIYVSGATELGVAAGLARRRGWAPNAATALLLVIWPGNWKMAVDLQRSRRVRPWVKAAAWLRVPWQLAMIAAVRRPVTRMDQPVGAESR
jgi:uncharacterized membrane protein